MSIQDPHFDVIVIGTGFGSLFFARKYLEKRPNDRLIFVEWGKYRDHEWQILNDRNSDIDPRTCHVTRPGEKPWGYTVGVGGGLNCWWGQAPRLIPADFEMRTRFGVLSDWPLGYNDLEPYYSEAETIMELSGDGAMTAVSPRSTPYPLPAHKISAPDAIMVEAQPDRHFAVPTGRASVSTATRNRCCAAAWCHRCAVDARFSAFNGMRDVLEHPNVTIVTEAEVRTVTVENGVARGVTARTLSEDLEFSADLIVLGANGVQSPAILLRSGIDTPGTGRGICEQVSFDVEVLLDGVDNFGGGSVATGINYSLYTDADRSQAGAALLNFENFPRFGLRNEYGRWRQTLSILVSAEDAPQASNRVTLAEDGTASVTHLSVSDYGRAGVARAWESLPAVLAPLPVEEIIYRNERRSESHIQCSLPMGHDRSSSVVDGLGRHHDVSNLVVVGSAVFTTCPPANPSLTVAALSLRSADGLVT